MPRALMGRGIIWTVVLLGACVPHRPYRTYDYADPTAGVPAGCSAAAIKATCQQVVLLPNEVAACTTSERLGQPGPTGAAHRQLVSRLRKSLVLRRLHWYSAQHAESTPQQTVVAD